MKKRFELRLTEHEKEKLIQNSNERGYRNVSQFIKDRCIYFSTPLVTLKEFNLIRFQISKIGNNINQLTKIMNIKKSTDEKLLSEILLEEKSIYNLLENLESKMIELEKKIDEVTVLALDKFSKGGI